MFWEYLKKLSKYIIYFFIGKLAILLIIPILLYIPSVQKFASTKAIEWLSHKTGSTVELTKFIIKFPLIVELQGLKIINAKQDTILNSKSISFLINPLPLLYNTLSIPYLNIGDTQINLYRSKDAVWNYASISDAIMSNDSNKSKKKKKATFNISASDINLHNISFNYNDSIDGIKVNAKLKSLQTHIFSDKGNSFRFNIKKSIIDGLDFSYTQTKEDKNDNDSDSSLTDYLIVNELLLKKSKISYKDSTPGSFNLYINAKNYLYAKINNLNIANNLFDIKNLNTDRVIVKIKLNQLAPNKTANYNAKPKNSQNLLKIAVNQAKLKKSHILYVNSQTPKKLGFDYNNMDLENLNLDIANFYLKVKKNSDIPDIKADLKHISFNETNSRLVLNDFQSKFLFNNHVLELNKLIIKTPKSQIKDKIIIKWPYLEKLDKNLEDLYINARLKNSHLNINDILTYDPSLEKNIFFTILKNETIDIDTKLEGKLKDINVDHLKIKDGNDFYASIHGKTYNITEANNIRGDLYVSKLYINSKKLSYLLGKANNMKQYLPIIKGARFVDIKGVAKGDLKNLDINLHANTALASANAQGQIKLYNTKNPYFNVDLKVKTKKTAKILSLLNINTDPNSYKLPNKIQVVSHITGRITDLNTKSYLITNQGSLSLNGTIKKLAGTYYYNTLIRLNNLNVGYFINKGDLIGKASGSFTLKGHSFNYRNAQLTFKADIKSINLKHYNYQNIHSNGSLNKKLIQFTASIDDENLQLEVDRSTINNRNNNLSIQSNATIYYANLKNINLVKDDLAISSTIQANFDNLTKENINGTLTIQDFIFARSDTSDIIDSLKITANTHNLDKHFKIESDFINASLQGRFKIAQLNNSINYVLASHLDNIVSYHTPDPQTQDIHLKLTLHKTKSISALLPDLKDFKDAQITAALNTINKIFVLKSDLPLIIYDNIAINDLSINTEVSKKNAEYHINATKLSYSDVSLNNINLNGQLKNNTLSNHIKISGENTNHTIYDINFQAMLFSDKININLSPELILNESHWLCKKDNEIQISKGIIRIHDLELYSGNSAIKIANTDDLLNRHLGIKFENFSISALSTFIQYGNTKQIINGTINGDINITNLQTKPNFNSNLTIDSLTIKDQLLGTLTLKTQQKDSPKIDIVSSLVGNGNDIALKGNYNLSNNNIDFAIKTDKLNVKIIESLSQKEVQNLQGDIYINASINGNIKRPNITGSVNIKNLSFVVNYLDTGFSIPNETIELSKNIQVKGFTILDEENHKAQINGFVNIINLQNITSQLQITTNNFKAIGNKNINKQNTLFYGPVYITSENSINTNSKKIDITSKLWVNNKTEINILMPNKNATIDTRDGIVRFVSNYIEKKTQALKNQLEKNTSTKKSKEKIKINLDATIHITEAAALKIILDKNGDELFAKGNATLNMTLKNGASPIMTGRYLITEGYYKLSMQNFITKKFDLQKDGFIAWEGSIEDASIDLNATHTVQAAPLPLVDGIIQNTSDEERNKFREKLPFNIRIHITNKLLKPNINFHLDLAESAQSRDISTTTEIRLKQINIRESELNKQVLGLLVFKRFIEDDPFDSLNDMDTDIEMKTRNTLGNLLSSQLNQLTNNAIKGIGINFGFNSKRSYQTGFADTQTNLDINLKKQLFNDRLTLTIGKSLAIEGKDAQTKNTSNLINNISLEYALTKNRHYRLLFYSTTTDYNPLQTDIRETGLNFVMYKNYNKLKQLFKKRKKTKKDSHNIKNDAI